MARAVVPPAAALVLWLLVAIVLPGAMALLGACPAPAVAPTLALTEAVGAFCVRATQDGDGRVGEGGSRSLLADVAAWPQTLALPAGREGPPLPAAGSVPPRLAPAFSPLRL